MYALLLYCSQSGLSIQRLLNSASPSAFSIHLLCSNAKNLIRGRAALQRRLAAARLWSEYLALAKLTRASTKSRKKNTSCMNALSSLRTTAARLLSPPPPFPVRDCASKVGGGKRKSWQILLSERLLRSISPQSPTPIFTAARSNAL